MKFSKFFAGIVFTGFALTLIGALPVCAETSGADSAQGVEISPALVDINVARGGTYSVTLRVRNVTNSTLVYSQAVEDFTSSGESGSPKIVQNSNLPETASVKTWIASIPSFSVEPKQQKVIEAKISVPSNAEPGGHYGVITFSGTAPELDSTGVGLSASAGVLLLVRVDGDIVENASLSEFFTGYVNDKKSVNQSWAFENSPITFVTRIKNDGNIHVKPVGNIEIRNMFGGVVKTLAVNDSKSSILPNSIRRFENVLNSDWMIGRYTASLTLGYGTTGQAITSTISFWVIPYKIILVALLILATIIFILKRLITVYNRHIIEKAKNEIQNKNKTSKNS